VAPPPVRLGFLRCLRFRSAIMSFFQRSVGRRLCFPALYPVGPAIGKRFFQTLSEGIANGPIWLVWLSRGPSAGTPFWSAMARRRFGSALSAPVLQPPPFETPKLTQKKKAASSHRTPQPSAAGGSDTRSGKRAIPCPPLDYLRPQTEFIGNERCRLPFVGVHLTITVLDTTRTPNTRPAPRPPRAVVRVAVVIVRKQPLARHVPAAHDGAGKTGNSFDESSFTIRPSIPNICS